MNKNKQTNMKDSELASYKTYGIEDIFLALSLWEISQCKIKWFSLLDISAVLSFMWDLNYIFPCMHFYRIVVAMKHQWFSLETKLI